MLSVWAVGGPGQAGQLEEMDQRPDADPMVLEANDCTSFKHVCHRCQGATWWNPIAILTGLLESERDRGE